MARTDLTHSGKIRVIRDQPVHIHLHEHALIRLEYQRRIDERTDRHAAADAGIATAMLLQFTVPVNDYG